MQGWIYGQGSRGFGKKLPHFWGQFHHNLSQVHATCKKKNQFKCFGSSLTKNAGSATVNVQYVWVLQVSKAVNQSCTWVCL